MATTPAIRDAALPARGMGARYRKTLRLAIRFALQLWWLKRTRFLVRPGRRAARASALYTKQARRFVAFATSMGGLIIKLGQFLSVRIDVLPREYIHELGALQDALPAVPTPELVAVIERELGRPLGDVFAEFDDEPLAAASLGQVHRARLVTGEDVAVKVLRPGVEDVIDTDVRSLRSIMRLLGRFTTISRYMDVDEFSDDFEATFRDELDYEKEARHAAIFERNFAKSDAVVIPGIYGQHSTRRVLTMEFMDGVKINELDALDAGGIDRNKVAVRLLELYLQMFLTDGFFHADPHPGNVFVRSDGVIQLLDFGMVGAIPDEQRRDYRALIVGVLGKDAGAVVDALRRLGFLRRGADTRVLKQVLGPLMESMFADVTALYSGAPVLDQMMSGEEVMQQFTLDKETLERLREFIWSQPISLPGNTTFIGKAFITVVSVCSALDPAIDIVGVAGPYLKREAASSVTEDLWPTVRTDLAGLLRTAVPTAKRLGSLAEKLDDGELEVMLADAEHRRLTAALAAQTTRLVWAIAGASVFLGGVLVTLLSAQWVVGVVVATVGAVVMVAQGVTGRRRRG